MRAHSYTFAAVDAPVLIYDGVTVAYSDRFGRAVLKASGAAAAFFNIKINRMLVCIHSENLPEFLNIYPHGDVGPDTYRGFYIHIICIPFHIRKSHSRAEAKGSYIVRRCGKALLHGLVNILYSRALIA